MDRIYKIYRIKENLLKLFATLEKVLILGCHSEISQSERKISGIHYFLWIPAKSMWE